MHRKLEHLHKVNLNERIYQEQFSHCRWVVSGGRVHLGAIVMVNHLDLICHFFGYAIASYPNSINGEGLTCYSCPIVVVALLTW